MRNEFGHWCDMRARKAAQAKALTDAQCISKMAAQDVLFVAAWGCETDSVEEQIAIAQYMLAAGGVSQGRAYRDMMSLRTRVRY